MAKSDIFTDGNRDSFLPTPDGTAYQEGPGRLRHLVSSAGMGTPVRTRELNLLNLEDSQNARRLLGSKTS